MSSHPYHHDTHVASFKTMKKHNIISKLHHVISMLMTVESVAVVNGFDPDYAVDADIEKIETMLHSLLSERYESLKEHITEHSSNYNSITNMEVIKKRVLSDPTLLCPTIVPSQRLIGVKPIIPIKLFMSNLSNSRIYSPCGASSIVPYVV